MAIYPATNAGAPRWRSPVEIAPRCPTSVAIPLIVGLHPLHHETFAWSRTDAAWRPLPDLERIRASWSDALTAGGRALVFQRKAEVDHPPLRDAGPVRFAGVYRLTFGDGSVERAAYEPAGGPLPTLAIAGSPSLESIAVAEIWTNAIARTRRSTGGTLVSPCHSPASTSDPPA